jgi:SsrA-binding protein
MSCKAGAGRMGKSNNRMRQKIICQNRKALHDYKIQDTYEAGIVLQGSEVKSLRDGRGNLKDSYAKIDRGEVYLINFHISPYPQAGQFNHDPLRPRKLLLHKNEIKRLLGKTTEKGLTLVPLKVYFSRGLAKVELALAKGKKLYDKREELKRRTAKIELERNIRERYR